MCNDRGNSHYDHRLWTGVNGKGAVSVEDFERRLDEWRREDLRERRRETLWNFAVNMIVALAALIVALKA